MDVQSGQVCKLGISFVGEDGTETEGYVHRNPDGSPGGYVAATAEIGERVVIHAGAIVCPGAVVGDGAEIGEFSKIEPGAIVPTRAIVPPQTLYSCNRLTAT